MLSEKTPQIAPLALGIIAACAYLLSRLGVRAIRQFAEDHMILDIPNERSSHSRPIPRGGGLAIVVVTIALTVSANVAFASAYWTALLLVTAAWTLVALVSLIDDLRSLPNLVRLIAHILAALTIMLGVDYWDLITLPLIGEIHLAWMGVPLTLMWLVGLTNAYNFMDGIDGIAGSQAVIAGITWAVVGFTSGLAGVGLTGLVLAGASAAFLADNWPPARIFMGDVGSAFIGLVLATLTIAAHQQDHRMALVGLLAVWPFVFDASFTFLRRLVRHENVFAAHRSHLYQRLIILDHSHKSVTILYASLAALGGVLAVAWVQSVPGVSLSIAIVIPVAAFSLWYFVRSHEQQRGPTKGISNP